MCKKRNRSAQIERAAVYHVCEVFSRMNWNPTEIHPDYGEDLHVKSFDVTTRQSLSLAFNVQVKGTTRHTVKNSCLHFSIRTADIIDWVKGNVPVLLVVCSVDDKNIVYAAHYLWVDRYTYSTLRWPIGLPITNTQKSTTLKIPIDNVFDTNCRSSLQQYINQWGPIAKTEHNLHHYLTGLSQDTEDDHRKRGIFFKWELFALPIRYQHHKVSAQTQVAEDAASLIKSAQRKICLLGKPATGKTTTIDRLKARPPDNLIPVPIEGILPAKKEELFKHLSSVLTAASPDHIEYLYEQRRFLLIVDGLNERKRFEKLSKPIIDLSEALSKARIIVTCRIDDYNLMRRPLKGFDLWEICPLRNKDQNDFINKQEQDKRAVLRAKFKNQSRLRELCRNQFLFLISLELILEKGPKGLPMLKSELYERFLNRYLIWMKIDKLWREKIIEFLSQVAFEMRRGKVKRTTISVERLAKILAKEVGANLVSSLKERLFEHGLLEKVGRYCTFFQETLQEYLCARYLICRGILPNQLDEDTLSFDGVELNDMIRSFYVEAGRFNTLIKDKYTNKDIWL